MTAALEADPAAVERLVRTRRRNARITALVTVPPAALQSLPARRRTTFSSPTTARARESVATLSGVSSLVW